MKLNHKKTLFFAMCGILLAGLFFIENKDWTGAKTFPSQDLLTAQVVATVASPKNIALTFDDGPYGTSTEKILNILKQENIHATFFIIGKNVEKFPDLAKRIVAEGHLIGNHSYDHSKTLPEMSTTTFETNIQQAESAIFSVTGLKPHLFRPPYGNITGQMYGKLINSGYKTILWNIDARDWDYENISTEYIKTTIVHDAVPDGIILMHDGRDTKINYPRGNTIGALPYIIEQLKKEGYTFVTLDKLLKIEPYFDEK